VLLGAWLAAALFRRGFEPLVRPGMELLLRRGPHELEPAAVVAALAEGRLGEREYLERCAAWEAAHVLDSRSPVQYSSVQ
jgi:hypothetical protein